MPDWPRIPPVIYAGHRSLTIQRSLSSTSHPHATFATSSAHAHSHVSGSVREWGLTERIQIVNCQITIYPRDRGTPRLLMAILQDIGGGVPTSLIHWIKVNGWLIFI
jgi:hypothetical protein